MARYWQNYWFGQFFSARASGLVDRSGDGSGKELEGTFGFEVVGYAVA
jgi:hypothetical protein